LDKIAPMIELTNTTDFQPDINLLERLAQRLSERPVELILTDNAAIQELNRQHRDIDKPTDVLSFPLENVPFAPLGSVVISVDFVRNKAQALGHTPQEEAALLFLHGLLHLLGYDHETDEGQMRREEERIIREFSLPESLIVRTEENA